MFHFCFAVAKTSSRIHLVKTGQTGYLGGLPRIAQKVRVRDLEWNKHPNDYKGGEERCFSISGSPTKERQLSTAAAAGETAFS